MAAEFRRASCYRWVHTCSWSRFSFDSCSQELSFTRCFWLLPFWDTGQGNGQDLCFYDTWLASGIYSLALISNLLLRSSSENLEKLGNFPGVWTTEGPGVWVSEIVQVWLQVTSLNLSKQTKNIKKTPSSIFLLLDRESLIHAQINQIMGPFCLISMHNPSPFVLIPNSSQLTLFSSFLPPQVSNLVLCCPKQIHMITDSPILGTVKHIHTQTTSISEYVHRMWMRQNYWCSHFALGQKLFEWVQLLNFTTRKLSS